MLSNSFLVLILKNNPGNLIFGWNVNKVWLIIIFTENQTHVILNDLFLFLLLRKKKKRKKAKKNHVLIKDTPITSDSKVEK